MKRLGEGPTILSYFDAKEAREKEAIPIDLSDQSQRQPLNFVRIAPEKKLRKVTIPALATATHIPKERFDEIWSELKAGVEQLFESGVENVNFMRNYKDVEFYCQFGSCKTLYDQLVSLLSDLIQALVASIGTEMDLPEIATILSRFEVNIVNLRKIFLCLDRLYIFANRIDGYMSVMDLVHSMARKQFLENPTLVDVLIQKIRFQIHLLRCHQSDSNEPLKDTLAFMSNLNLYDEYIEPMLFEQTQEFFSQVSEELTLEQFLQWYSMAMEKEAELSTCGVKESTMNMVYKIIRKVCLEDHSDRIFGPDFEAAIENDSFEEIRTVYDYFNSDDVRHIFCEKFGDYFASKIEKSIKEKKDASDLIAIYRAAKEVVIGSFGDSSPLMAVVKSGVDRGLSTESATVAKLLAQHFGKGLPLSEFDSEILEMCHARDVFEALYRYNLSQRILSWNYVDIPREQELIRVFKNSAGAEFTERLERMIKDLDEAKLVSLETDSFRQMIVSNMAFAVGVLEEQAKFPPEIQSLMDQCAETFIGDRKHMLVKWSATLSSAEMKINDTECIMSADQALILLAMSRGIDTVDALVEVTGVSQETVSNNMVVFQKKRSGRIVLAQGDKFVLNPAVKFDKEPPIHFPASSIASLEKDHGRLEGSEEYVLQNRLQCAIVEKMKIFKQLKLSELKQMVQKSLQSSIDTAMFIRVIKQLEDKFIEKSGERSYRYLTM